MNRRFLTTLGILALLALIVGLSFRGQKWPPPNLYAVQAQSWLEGRTDVDPKFEDVSLHAGRAYVPFPPFPSVLLIPLVAIFGVDGAPLRALAGALTLVAAWALLGILKRLDIDRDARGWLLCAFFLGTAYWQCVLRSGGVWFFAHVVAVTGLLLALREALGSGRALLVGLFLGLAFLSRQLSIFTVPFAAFALWETSKALPMASRMKRGLAFAAGLGACVAAYLVYNWARFSNPLDTGYSGIALSDHLRFRFDRYGLFHPAYIPFNFIHLFIEGMHVEFGSERLLTPLHASDMGTSLTIASPFVCAALWARGSRWMVRIAWLCVAAAVAQGLLYYNNGWVQVNAQRFSLDFLPLLIVLVGMGTKRLHPAVWKTAIAWAVGLNAFALVGLPFLSRVLRGL